MTMIDKDTGVPASGSTSLTVSELIARIDRTWGMRIQVKARSLREVMMQLIQANRVAAIITREILAHLQHVFGSIGSSMCQPVGYGASGSMVTDVEHAIFDAVG